MIRVLCVEDDALMRSYLLARLALEPDLHVVEAVRGAGEAMAILRRTEVDVVLVDYQLEGADGLQLVGALRAAAGGPRVLFCTGRDDARFEAAVRGSGAAGMVIKTRMAAELIPALRAVAGGGEWFPAVDEP